MVRGVLPLVLLCAIAFAGCAEKEGGGDGGASTDTGTSGTATGTETGNGTSTSTGSATNTTTGTATNTTTPRPAQTVQKDVTDNSFPGGTFTIQKGDTVRWTHKGTAPHTVTSNAGGVETFDSHPNCPPVCMVATQTFTHTFDTVGDVSYRCKVHGSMTGTITVVEALPA
jgi:plastocyanin